MKKITLTIVLMCATVFIYGQTIGALSSGGQWAGSSTTSGNIYRSGNVGIGISNPQDDLQIGTGLFLHNGGTQQIGFRFRPEGTFDTDPSRYGASLRFDPNSGQFSMGVSSTLTNTPSRILIVSRTGRVGVGTALPDAKLTVNGDIHAKEVRVDLNIPADYVFEKYYTGASTLKSDYVMPTLEEVASFTKQNNHLPGVPSAKDIQEEGLKLKEMTNLLLQKIEELTLYTIEQEKRIKELESLISKK